MTNLIKFKNILLCSFYVYLILFSNESKAQQLFQETIVEQSRELQTPSIAKAYLLPINGDVDSSQRALDITGHKPFDWRVDGMNLMLGVNVANLAATTMNITAPAGYTIVEDCLVAQRTTPLTVTVAGQAHTLTGTTVSSCKADANERSAIVTFPAPLANSADALKLWGIIVRVQTAPPITPADNEWEVTSSTETKMATGGEIFAVKGWPSTFVKPSSAIGTPGQDAPSMRPTKLTGGKNTVMSVYFTTTTGLPRGTSSFFIVFADPNLSFEVGYTEAESCSSVDAGVQICDATSCDIKTVGEWDSTNSDLKCRVNGIRKYIVFTPLTFEISPAARQGVYVQFKAFPANENHEFLNNLVVTAHISTETLYAGWSDYFSIIEFKDQGVFARDVEVAYSAAYVLEVFLTVFVTIISI